MPLPGVNACQERRCKHGAEALALRGVGLAIEVIVHMIDRKCGGSHAKIIQASSAKDVPTWNTKLGFHIS